eukprot:1187030-Prorocentrum_minimum.AAC.2
MSCSLTSVVRLTPSATSASTACAHLGSDFVRSPPPPPAGAWWLPWAPHTASCIIPPDPLQSSPSPAPPAASLPSSPSPATSASPVCSPPSPPATGSSSSSGPTAAHAPPFVSAGTRGGGAPARAAVLLRDERRPWMSGFTSAMPSVSMSPPFVWLVFAPSPLTAEEVHAANSPCRLRSVGCPDSPAGAGTSVGGTGGTNFSS